MKFDDGIYPGFVQARINCIMAHVGRSYFNGKTVLEVGCGYGLAGKLLEDAGAKVTSVDSRSEHIDVVRQRYPHRRVGVIDFNKDDGCTLGQFDVIVALGLLYHLEEPEFFLRSMVRLSPVIFLCSLVCDITAPVCRKTTFGCLPSPAWVQKQLETLWLECEDISSGIANVAGNVFDWKSRNDGAEQRGGNYLRRMWYAHRPTNEERLP